MFIICFNKLFSEMNLNPQIFLFWFSLEKVTCGWGWSSDEVNISKETHLASSQAFVFSTFLITSLHFLFSLWTDSRRASDPAEVRKFEDYEYYDYGHGHGLERIGESDDYYYYYLDDDQYQYQDYPEDRSGQWVSLVQ